MKADERGNQSETLENVESIKKVLMQISRSLAVFALRVSPNRPKTGTEQIHYLSNLGFEAGDIAAILGTTQATVAVRLSEKRKSQGSGRKPRGKNKSKASRKARTKDRRGSR